MAREGGVRSFGEKKIPPKCSLLLVKGPPLSGWLPGEAPLRVIPPRKLGWPCRVGVWQQLAGGWIRFQSTFCIDTDAKFTKAIVRVSEKDTSFFLT